MVALEHAARCTRCGGVQQMTLPVVTPWPVAVCSLCGCEEWLK